MVMSTHINLLKAYKFILTVKDMNGDIGVIKHLKTLVLSFARIYKMISHIHVLTNEKQMGNPVKCNSFIVKYA